jgi:hypothetical protein
MNTQKAVYNRLFSEQKKTELETHKVELGLIDDLNKALEESEETIKSLTADVKRINELNKLADKRDKSLEDDVVEIRNMVISVNKKGAATTKKAQRQIAIFDKNISKANKMAQDLGVKLPIAKYEKAQEKLKSLI